MKGIILYQSKYGATKRYADWISEETGFDRIETKKAKIETVEQYETIILGAVSTPPVLRDCHFSKNISPD